MRYTSKSERGIREKKSNSPSRDLLTFVGDPSYSRHKRVKCHFENLQLMEIRCPMDFYLQHGDIVATSSQNGRR